jgi:hypothetical protein
MNKIEKTYKTEFAIASVAVIILLIWLLYEKKRNKKLRENAAANKLDSENLSLSITELDNQKNHWQTAYYNQADWFQQFQHIPNPQESIKALIERLENMKRQIFQEKPDFVKEIDDAIYALRGEKLQTSLPILAKIMENLLESNFMEDEGFKSLFEKK